jgi:hypothetical protein
MRTMKRIFFIRLDEIVAVGSFQDFTSLVEELVEGVVKVHDAKKQPAIAASIAVVIISSRKMRAMK